MARAGRRFLVYLMLAIAAVGGGMWAYPIVRSMFIRQIEVCVVHDFSFRDQKPNWQYQLNLWFAEVNRIFEPAGIRWVAKAGGNSYSEDTEGRLMDRRELIEETTTCKADVVMGFTAIPDRTANSSVVPFGHVGVVAVTAPDSDAVAVQTLSRAFARLFAVNVGTETMVMVDAPQSDVLDAASLRQIESLRDYDFAKGISALNVAWERKALAAIRNGMASRKPNPEAESYGTLGRAFSSLYKHGEAVRLFREAVRLAPRDARMRFELAMALQADAQPEEAIAELRRVSEIDPEDARAHAVAGTLFLNRNRIYEAVEELRLAVSLDAGNADYQEVLGRALSTRVGHGAEAAAAFEAALRLKPADSFARNSLESINSDADAVKSLVAQLAAETRANPASALVHIRYGMALAAAGDRAGAVKALRRSLDLEPENAVAHQALARVYYMEGQYAEAKQNLDRAQAEGAPIGKDFAAALQRKLELR